MVNKKIVNANTIVENDVAYVYDHCSDVLWDTDAFSKETKVLSKERQEKIRGLWHQFAGNVGNKILSITMNNEEDFEIKSDKLQFLSGKAADKALEVNADIVKILGSKKVPLDVALKTSAVCADDVFERHKAATKETVSAVFEKQELASFKDKKAEKEKVAVN